jgi:hypothetical protein
LLTSRHRSIFKAGWIQIRMKRIIIACLYGVLILPAALSCQDTVTIQSCHVTQHIVTGVNFKRIFTYLYDNNNYLKAYQVVSNGDSSFNYIVTTNSQGYVTLMTTIPQLQPIPVYGDKMEFTYDQNNNLTQSKDYTSDSKVRLLENYTYNSFSQLILIQQDLLVTGSQKQDSMAYYYFAYTYADSISKNPTAINKYYGTATGKADTTYQTIALLYDTYKSPPNLPGLTNDFDSFATNNVTSAVISKRISSDSTSVDNYLYTYQYNYIGYPVSRSLILNNTNSTTDTYVHDCK